MTYQVRLRKYNSNTNEWETAYTFDARPFVSPSIEIQHTDAEPPRPSGSLCRWTVQAMLYGTSGAVADAWNELRTAIESSTAPVQGIQLLKDGVVIEEISPEGGYVGVKVESIESPKTDPQWVASMVALVVVSGLKPIATSVDGIISNLSYTLTYSYDEAGLLTETLEGELSVVQGQSAEAAARTMGLELPSANFALVTRGPEGVDVEVLDSRDLNARFTSTIREAGDVLPTGVGPGFSVEVETVTVDGVDTTTTTVTAEGPDAVDAVKSKRPAGKFTETQSSNAFRRTARAVYVQRATTATAPSPSVKRQAFRATGGGRSVKWSRRTGGRSPVKHYGAFAEVNVTEELLLEKFGTPGENDFKLPQPVNFSIAGGSSAIPGLEEDLGGFEMGFPVRVEIGKDRSSDRWQCTVTRRYTGPDFQSAYAAIMRVVFAPGDSSTIALEAQRRGKGVD